MEPGKKKTTETPLKSAKKTIPKTPKSFVQALTSSSPPATNYPAEQDIRIAVVNRKTCGGGNRTAKGAQAQSILMSVLQSCRHKGIRVIDIVTSILRAPDNTPVPLVNPER